MKTEEAYIFIENCSKEELKIMLNDWLVMYAVSIKSKTTFGIAETGSNNCLLKVDRGIDDTKFFYMVNYFSYPADFNRTFEVEGYTTATKHKKLHGSNIYVFINEQDKECDNVWITTEGDETYKFDFGGKLKKTDSENKYKKLNITDQSTTYEQITVDKKALLEEAKRREDEKSKRNMAKRFKIISILLFISITLAYLINRYFSYMENDFLVFFSSFVIMMWFMVDYKILYNLKRTSISVLLSLFNIVLGVKLQDFSDDVAQGASIVFGTFPLSAIVVMLVANKIFGAKLGRIMEMDRFGRLFSFILFVVILLISLFVFSPFLMLLI